jgi:hypothetical protein
MDKIPHVYYINSNHRTDLKEYIEKNFDSLGISNYTRIEKKYNLNNYNEWNNLLDNESKVDHSIISDLSLSLILIETIKKWLESTDDEMMIITSDTVDFECFKYFHFDLEYFFKNLPHDWDSILLGFEDLLGVLPCFLHPVSDSHGSGATLIKRRYAEKLIKLHFKNNKFNFFNKISNNFWKNSFGYVSHHYFMNQCGRSYAIPLFPRNPELTEDLYFSKDNLILNKKLHLVFWKKLRDKVPPEQFFCYFSPKDLYLNSKKKTISVLDTNINRLF